MRTVFGDKHKGEEHEDSEIRARGTKCYELCAGAANHITSIGEAMFCVVD